jgi:hypothetical protein
LAAFFAVEGEARLFFFCYTIREAQPPDEASYFWRQAYKVMK